MARLWGSDAMRLQIRKSMAPHLPANIHLTFSGMPLGRKSAKRILAFQAWLKTRPRAIFILLKNVAYRISPEELAELKKRAIAVGVDHLDAEPSRIELLQYDFHISASESGRRGLDAILAEDCPTTRRRPLVELLFQSYDWRLDTMRPKVLDRLSAVYLGAAENALIPSNLSNAITLIQVERNEEMERVAHALEDYNFHYAVRPRQSGTLRRPYKPFTKGVMAAACQSNILVNRDVDDAIDFLTADYPYLVNANAPEEVEDMFLRAREGFGGSEWNRGLEIMRDVRERVSGAAQARQFARILNRVADFV